MIILIVEDEKELQKILSESLAKAHSLIELASNFHTDYENISLYQSACILLDLMLPGGDGLELLKKIKKSSLQENVIIISARGEIEDKIKGLDLGADDYLAKPFHIAELNARIKAVLRRKNTEGKNTIAFANLSLDLDERSLKVNQEEVVLNRKEFDILSYFLFNQNRLVSKTALAEHVWGDYIDQADNFDFIYSQIKNLRKKLKDSKAEIEAVYGMGYKLVEK